MSLPKKDRKIPAKSRDGPARTCDSGVTVASRAHSSQDQFATVISGALRREFGETHAAVKTVVRLTNANERAVKNWFAAKNGPTGRHLVDLTRTSEEVLEAVLIMSNRRDLLVMKKLGDTKRIAVRIIKLLGQLEQSNQ